MIDVPDELTTLSKQRKLVIIVKGTDKDVTSLSKMKEKGSLLRAISLRKLPSELNISILSLSLSVTAIVPVFSLTAISIGQ